MQVFPFVRGPEGSGIGEDFLEKLERGYFDSADRHGFDVCHADIFKHGEMVEVVFGEGHP